MSITKPEVVPTIIVTIKNSDIVDCTFPNVFISQKLKDAGIPIKPITDFTAAPAPLRGTIQSHQSIDTNEIVFMWRDVDE